MDTLIGTVGFFDEAQSRGFIHPDFEFQAHGISVLVTSEGLRQSGIETLTSGYRVTCVVSQGQEGPQAFEIKEYHGQGL